MKVAATSNTLDRFLWREIVDAGTNLTRFFFFFFPSECHAADPVNRRISLLSLVSLESSSCGPAAFTLFSAFPFDARNSSRQTRHFPTKYSGPPTPFLHFPLRPTLSLSPSLDGCRDATFYLFVFGQVQRFCVLPAGSPWPRQAPKFLKITRSHS